MNETQPPAGGNRWRSGCGCSGCALVLLVFVAFGIFIAALGLDAATGTMPPPAALRVTGVVLRTLLNDDPPHTDVPDSLTDVTGNKKHSAEELAYLNTFDWDRYWVKQSELRLRVLDIFSSLWHSRWLSQLAAEADGWRQLSANVQQLNPPEGYEAFHGQFVEAFTLYAAAADDIDQFVSTGDTTALDNSQAALQRGDALIADARQSLNGNGESADAIGPIGSSDEMIAGLARADNLPTGWSTTSIPDGYDEYGPISPCTGDALFYSDEINASAAVRFEKPAQQDGYLQEVLVHVGEHSAETGMLLAKADFPCETSTDDDGYSYHIAPLDVPVLGDDTVGYQYTVLDDAGNVETIANVILIRTKGLVLEVWHSQAGSAPALTETKDLARALLAQAQTIPIGPEPDPGNGIQVHARMGLPSG